MPYYKNVINSEVVGLTESPYTLNVENFFEIDEEEYVNLGGSIRTPNNQNRDSDSHKDSESSLVSALID